MSTICSTKPTSFARIDLNTSAELSAIKRGLPLLSKHEGVWDGWYRHYDPNGNKIDEHRSRLVCRFPDNGERPYHQTNYYSWAECVANADR